MLVVRACKEEFTYREYEVTELVLDADKVEGVPLAESDIPRPLFELLTEILCHHVIEFDLRRI